MTVEDLIDELERLPQTATVLIVLSSGEPAEFIHQHGVVLIVGDEAPAGDDFDDFDEP